MSDTVRENGGELSPLKRALLAIERLQTRLQALESERTQPIAVVGMSGRFPGGAESPAEFGELLRAGHDAILPAPPVPRPGWSEAGIGEAGDFPPAGYLHHDVGAFDPQFFGISPREAASIDPQQRLVLECAWEALEHAGLNPRGLEGSRTGVFVGLAASDYAQMQIRSERAGQLLHSHFASGIGHSMASGRISYLLGLQGPAITVDTACSSSLVAVHLACQSLRQGESDLALAAGVNLILAPDFTLAFQQSRMLAEDGRCRTFDAAADGFSRAEGCGVVVLKRLSDAEREGARILAVIRGSAVNQDGPSSGLTAPNGPAQEAVIRAALAGASLAPGDIGYLEAHGTGTALGDPIEMQAIGAVFSEQSRPEPLWVGSVKTNLGHLEAAAGIAGLIKCVLTLQAKQIPPHLHFHAPSPHIPWDRLPVAIPTACTPFPLTNGARRAGVSSFGFSGTNAHVILEEAPEAAVPGADEDVQQDRPLHLLTLSAPQESALQELARRYVEHLETSTERFADLCHTAAAGRAHFAHRLALTASNAVDARNTLHSWLEGGHAPRLKSGTARPERPALAFLFTGQGAQYPGMGWAMQQSSPVVREALLRCQDLLRTEMEVPLLELLDPASPHRDQVHRTDLTQPALFALQYALSELWKSWGIVPDLVLGHSIGEFAAAHLAGVFSLEDALHLVCARGRLMQAVEREGRMTALSATEERVRRWVEEVGGAVSVAAINAPLQVVVSGAVETVDGVEARARMEGVEVHRLRTSQAFHSPLMDGVAEAMTAELRRVELRPARKVRFVSALTGAAVQPGELADPSYWVRQLREPVRFADAVRAATAHAALAVEIGPHPALAGLVAQGESELRVLPSLHREKDAWETILTSLGDAYLAGLPVDWSGVDAGLARRTVDLPAPPFQRTPLWVDLGTGSAGLGVRGGHPLLGRAMALPGKARCFERTLRADTPAFIGEHRVLGRAILPGTAYFEMALAAGRDLFGTAAEVRELDLLEVMPFEGDARRVHCRVEPQGNEARIEILSTPEPAGAGAHWTLHAAAHLAPAALDSAALDVGQIRSRCPAHLEGSAFHRTLAERGYHFGPRLRGVIEAFVGTDEVLGRIALPAACEEDADGYLAHPLLLDAGLQLVGLALEDGATRTYLPVAVRRVSATAKARSAAWVHARITQRASGMVKADVAYLGAEGTVVARVEGIAFREAPALVGGEDPFLEVRWVPEPAVPEEDRLPGAAELFVGTPWLVVANEDGLAEAVARQLEATGARVERVTAAEIADPVAGATRLVERLGSKRRWAGVLHCGGLESPSEHTPDPAGLAARVRRGVGTLLSLAQALVTGAEIEVGRLCVLTRGAQVVSTYDSDVDPAAAPLWGLARSIALELPSLACFRLDLDPVRSAADAERVVAWMHSETTETELALRGEVRLVPRLLPRPARRGAEEPALPAEYRLVSKGGGSIDQLAFGEGKRREPDPGQVEIRVAATGMNFKDVLNVLGMYPGDPGPLGAECAGTVSAVGEGVARLRVGDPVVAATGHAYGRHVLAEAALVAPKPPRLSYAEAATLPVAYLTAHFALNHLGRMGPGDRVLIHAAAGGVGMAACALARRAGAEVFATAGSEEKRALLRAQGVPHVFDSRSGAFAGEILHATRGQGVTMVLNSLADELVERSFEVLAPGGRFLEIGKRGIWSAERVATLGRGIEYHVIDWSVTARQDPELVGGLFAEVMTQVEQGELAPLPFTRFPLERVQDAFRHMAHARHVGKVILTHPVLRTPESLSFRPEATYLITGGTSGLGLASAGWAVERGARTLVLVARREPGAEAEQVIAGLRARGADVRVWPADVGNREQVGALLGRIRAELPQLRGIIHSAGELADRTLQHATWEDFERVLGAKVHGTNHLAEAARSGDLDFFVSYSSVAATFGSPGQGNYAAANAFLDAFAATRWAAGQVGMSIAWGPWKQTGVAARAEVLRRTEKKGFTALTTREGLAWLERAFARPSTQLVGTRVERPEALGLGRGAPLVSALERVAPVVAVEFAPSVSLAHPDRSLTEELAAAPVGTRRTLVMNRIRERIRAILELPSTTPIEHERPLGELGLDSLLAVELRNALGMGAGRRLPATLLFDHPTLAALTEHLLGILQPGAAGLGEPSPAPAGDILASVETLSDEDVDRLLNERMDRHA